MSKCRLAVSFLSIFSVIFLSAHQDNRHVIVAHAGVKRENEQGAGDAKRCILSQVEIRLITGQILLVPGSVVHPEEEQNWGLLRYTDSEYCIFSLELARIQTCNFYGKSFLSVRDEKFLWDFCKGECIRPICLGNKNDRIYVTDYKLRCVFLANTVEDLNSQKVPQNLFCWSQNRSAFRKFKNQ